MILLPILLLPILLLTACKREDMYTQQRPVPWGSFSFFRHDMTMQHPVPGTVARNPLDTPVPQPAAITAPMLARGQQQFGIFCAPCHGAAGDSHGMIVERSFPRPPVLFSEDLIKASARHFYDVITHGKGVMYSYADRVSPADRWAIIAYIRALQRSQAAQVASLPAEDRTRLQEATR
jgi:mono/diheme cytochrome c family protein